MAEHLNFPIKWDKCPMCGDNRTVARMVADEEVEKGKITPGMATGTSFGSMSIADPTKSMLSAPAMTWLKDICVGCGFERVVYIHCKDMPLTVVTQQLPKEFQNP